MPMEKKFESWRDYQRRLQGKTLRQQCLKGGLWLLPLLIVAGLGLQLWQASPLTGSPGKPADAKPVDAKPADGEPMDVKSVDAKLVDDEPLDARPSSAKSAEEQPALRQEPERILAALTKQDLRGLVSADSLLGRGSNQLEVPCAGKRLKVETTLDWDLQGYVQQKMDRSLSPLIAFVAMDPETGQVLAMAESRKNGQGEGNNICLSSCYPAASIFKIVTATAAIDRLKLSPGTTLDYYGRDHTLYKRQLTERSDRHANRVSLEKSFAKSINPVFGKLGVFRLKKDLLEEYASRFGFNEPIEFELQLEPSHIAVGEESYNWAEIASGFNRTTSISPLHGAVMAAAVFNGGRLVKPTLVKRIADPEKNESYVPDTKVLRRVMTRAASEQMKTLMQATISEGTSRRTFRGYRRDPVLSKLLIGGKTGSISSKDNRFHYDWFVGFCAQKNGSKKLAIAVLVVHDKLRREKAQEFARLGMKYYFKQS